ncbi:unnamed protein product, partial [Ostreobium quekettii]
LQVAQGAAAAQGQERLAEGQKEHAARLKSIREILLHPPTETVHDMFMALVNQPELPEITVGLDDRAQEVLKMVKEMEGTVLGVAGMGGVGKTTLVLAVYWLVKNSSQFDATCWVTVSQTPDLIQCQRQIWTQLIGSPPPAFRTAEQGFRLLLHELADKNVFIVLDDIWNFGDLKLLQVVKTSGKIVFTTRKSDIARRAQAGVYEHRILDDQQSQVLFNLKAFGAPTVPEDKQEFQAYAREMAAECEGLPLALTVIGSLARGYALLHEWKVGCHKLKTAKVLDEEHDKQVLRILRSSLDDLDKDEQAFFLFLVALPEDYHMGVSDLVEQWVALSHDEASDGEEECIEIWRAKAYAVLGRLLDRHMVLSDKSGFPRFQRDEKDALMAVVGFRESGLSTVSCHLHDTIREMGLQAANEEERHLLISGSCKLQQPAIAKARGLSMCHTSQSFVWPEGAEAPHMEWLVLREMGLATIPATIFLSGKLTILDMSFSRLASVPPEIGQLQELRLLRLDGCSQLKTLAIDITRLQRLLVLSVRLCESLKELPTDIGKLKQLTCLHCPGCGLSTLPRSIGDLENMTQLDLSFCAQLKELPSSLGDASQLEHLSVAGCPLLKSLPSSVHQLKELVTLIAAGCCGLEELPSLWPGNLQLLDLQGCQRLTAIPVGIQDLSHLKALLLQGCTRLERFPNSGLPSLQIVGLPLVREKQLQDMVNKRELDVGEARRIHQKPLSIRGENFYLLCGELDEEWLKSVVEMVKWLPQGTHYNYIAMKKLGRGVLDMKAALEGTIVADEYGQTPLHHAARDGDVDALENILGAGVSVDGRDKSGKTALMHAAGKGRLGIVEKLVAVGADVQQVDQEGNTALLCAAFYCHAAVANKLLDSGADVGHQSKSGRNALLWAAYGGSTDIVERLLSLGIDVDHTDKEGNTALLWAAQRDHAAVANKLLDSGADVGCQDKEGNTALLIAAQYRLGVVIEKLLAAGADVNHKNKEGKTALQLDAESVFYWNKSVAEVLLRHGASE